MRTLFHRRLNQRSDQEIARMFALFNRMVLLATVVMGLMAIYAIYLMLNDCTLSSIVTLTIAILWAAVWLTCQGVINQIHFERQNERSNWPYENLK